MLKKNDLLRDGDVFVRILDVAVDRVLVVRSDSKALPHWVPGDALEDYDVFNVVYSNIEGALWSK